MTCIRHDLSFGFVRTKRYRFGMMLAFAICLVAGNAEAWTLNDRTPTDPATGAPILAGVIGLTGYISSSPDQQHVDFIGTDNHVHELVFDGGRWSHFDLFSSAHVPTHLLAGSGLVGYTYLDQQHVVFNGGGGHIHELVFVFGEWRHTDLTGLVVGTPILGEDGIDAYTSSSPNQQHINFVGSDNHVHELVFDGGRWSHFDLFKSAGIPTGGANAVLAAGFRLDGYTSSSPDQQHVNFIGLDQHVHELVFDGGHWSHFDLFKSAGVPTTGGNAAAADVLAGLAGYVSTSPDQQHVDFVSTDGHVHELMFGGGAWHHSDLTKNTGGNLVAGVISSSGCGIAAYDDGQQHVNFIANEQGDNGRINQLFFSAPPGRWRHLDLLRLVTPPGPPPAVQTTGRYCLNGYKSPDQHLNFIDTNGHIFELFD